MTPLLSVKNVTKTFPAGKGMKASKARVHAVNNISFDIYPGETFSVVGESGCGKSTTGRLVDHLLVPDSGEIWFNGQDISKLTEKEMRPLRKDIQMIFQDPNGSLNPRMRVEDLVAEPLLVHTNLSAAERLKVAHELLQIVGLGAKHARRYPHEFSGGQRQRIGIARALALNPGLIICDEPVSALDVSIQAQILNLMQELKEKHGLTYIFISHNLSVVHHLCDRIAVMYLGNVVEIADKKQLFEDPRHPYAKALLDAIPVPDPERVTMSGELEGDVPSPLNPPSGCCFHTRCKFATERCGREKPALAEVEPGHQVACHLCAGKTN